jgi:prepilin signal peptidase PulO-like enzyme (type II secretory pathway)
VSATVGALAAVGGGLGALAWEPLEPWLIARSEGAEELLEQPPWTRAVTSRPVLMFASAIACGAAGLRFGATRELIPALVLAFALVGISAIDLRYRIIPDRISLPLAVAGLVLAAVLRPSDLPELLIAAFGAGAFLLFAALLSPSGMGMGDVKLVFVLGLFTGRSVVIAVVLGLVGPAIPMLLLLPRYGLRARKLHLALGPFLALGGMVALLAGDDIISWYTGG